MGGGVLSLAAALNYATGVAAGLRERHAEMCPHVPLPPAHSSQPTGRHSDIAAFGALLYELMAGSRPPRDLSQVVLPQVPQEGPEAVRTAATRLALQCLGAAGAPPENMQRILTEVRLYSLMARHDGRQRTTAMEPAVSPSLTARRNPLPAMTGAAAPARARNTAASFQPKTGPRWPVDAYPPPKRAPSLNPEWFVVPADRRASMLPSKIACPVCGGCFVHRSRPRTGFERLLMSTGIRLNRCHRCLYRYVSILGIVFTKTAPFFSEPFY